MTPPESDSEIPTGLLFVDAPPAPEKMNVLLYGPPKAGKSTGAATAPGPILWVNLEGAGALGYARKIAAARGTVIREVRIGEGEDARVIMHHVVEHLKSPAGQEIRTVVIDTVGKLRDALIWMIVEPNSRNSLQQYGEVAKIIEKITRTLRDMPQNLVLLAHEDIDNTSDDRIVRPQIGGKTTEKVLAEVDVIAYVGAVEVDGHVRYMGQLVQGRGRRAGDRSGGLGNTRQLDLTEWLAAYSAALTPDESDLPWVDADIDPLADQIAAEVFGDASQ